MLSTIFVSCLRNFVYSKGTKMFSNVFCSLLWKSVFRYLNFPHWSYCHLFSFSYSCGRRNIAATLPVLYLRNGVCSKSSPSLNTEFLWAEPCTRAAFGFMFWVCEKGVFQKNPWILSNSPPSQFVEILCALTVYCPPRMPIQIQAPQNHTKLKPCFP